MAKPVQDSRMILVSGSSTGIGRATALELDKLGFRVFGSVRKWQEGEMLKKAVSVLSAWQNILGYHARFRI